jgi:hypothetical protein
MGKTNAYINIQNEAGIHANGYHNNGNCDPCIILETGETFTSQLDLAKHLGVNRAAVSNTICGRQQTCKGFHIISMSRMVEGADLILSRLRETSELEEAGKKWLAYEAEQERIRKEEEARIEEERKAKEEYEANVSKAIAKIERRKKTVGRIDAMRTKAVERLDEAMQEYEALTGHKYGAEDCVEVA